MHVFNWWRGRFILTVEFTLTFILEQDLKIDGLENIWVETKGLLIDVIYKLSIK